MADSKPLSSIEYTAWRNFTKIPPGRLESHPIHLWVSTLAFLSDADEEAAQIFISDLLDPSFCVRRHIDAVLNNPQPNRHGLSFLLTISHRKVLHCLSISNHVEALYRLIGGNNGERGVCFLTDICNWLLMGLPTKCSKETAVPSVDISLVALSIALSQAVQFDERVIYSDKVPGLLALIERVVTLAGMSEESGPYCFIMNRVWRLQRLVSLLGSENMKNGMSVKEYSRSSRDLGQLYGLDITGTKIFPNYVDIRKLGTESLPSTNFGDYDHPMGIDRLLNAHFRLLRHDSLSATETQISTILKALRNNPVTNFQSPGAFRNKTDTFVYDDARIQKLSFRNSCLVVELSLRSSPREREDWRKDRNRMQEDALICLVTHHTKIQSMIFLLISQGITEIKKSSQLRLNHQRTSVVAKPAQLDTQKELDHLLQLTWQQKGVRSILVEFPGVHIRTFAPILKNLMQMRCENRLPFYQWILPQSCSKTPVKKMPALYARIAGFFFSLRSILINKDEDFMLSPNQNRNESITARALESQTTLDLGQCEAIIMALTNEFALVRGPPGTGKPLS